MWWQALSDEGAAALLKSGRSYVDESGTQTGTPGDIVCCDPQDTRMVALYDALLTGLDILGVHGPAFMQQARPSIRPTIHPAPRPSMAVHPWRPLIDGARPLLSS